MKNLLLLVALLTITVNINAASSIMLSSPKPVSEDVIKCYVITEYEVDVLDKNIYIKYQGKDDTHEVMSSSISFSGSEYDAIMNSAVSSTLSTGLSDVLYSKLKEHLGVEGNIQ